MSQRDSVRVNIRIVGGNVALDGSIQENAIVLPMAVSPEVEPDVRSAGDELQKTLSVYIDRYGDSSIDVPSGGFLAMSALDLSYRLILENRKKRYNDLLERIQHMNTSIEEVISSCYPL